MIAAIFITLSFLCLFGFITLCGGMTRAIYLKLAFDFAAIAILGIEQPSHGGEARMLSVCFVVIGIVLTFLYFVIQRQEEELPDEL